MDEDGLEDENLKILQSEVPWATGLNPYRPRSGRIPALR